MNFEVPLASDIAECHGDHCVTASTGQTVKKPGIEF